MWLLVLPNLTSYVQFSPFYGKLDPPMVCYYIKWLADKVSIAHGYFLLLFDHSMLSIALVSVPSLIFLPPLPLLPGREGARLPPGAGFSLTNINFVSPELPHSLECGERCMRVPSPTHNSAASTTRTRSAAIAIDDHFLLRDIWCALDRIKNSHDWWRIGINLRCRQGNSLLLETWPWTDIKGYIELLHMQWSFVRVHSEFSSYLIENWLTAAINLDTASMTLRKMLVTKTTVECPFCWHYKQN